MTLVMSSSGEHELVESVDNSLGINQTLTHQKHILSTIAISKGCNRAALFSLVPQYKI